MHGNEQNQKQGDRLLKMPGKLERGPLDFKSRVSVRKGEIMAVATRDVISVPPTMNIIGAVRMMTSHGFRRLPVTDPGTNKIRGLVTAGDIISMMGGGSKYNLVQVKHRGNLIAAINESVREIMTERLVTLSTSDSFADAVNTIVARKCGGLPITDDEGVLRGIITERDVLRVLSAEESSWCVEDVMTPSPQVTSPDASIGEVCHEMEMHHFRRLPVVSEDVLFGIITTMDIMKHVGNGGMFSDMVTGDAADMMGLSVRELMSGELFTTVPDQNICDIAKEMLDKNVGALPVIENSHLVGVVTEFDLVKALSEG